MGPGVRRDDQLRYCFSNPALAITSAQRTISLSMNAVISDFCSISGRLPSFSRVPRTRSEVSAARVAAASRFNDRRRRSRRHHDAGPAFRGDLLQADLRHGRRIRHRGQPRCGRRGQHFQFSRLHMRADRNRIIEHHIDASADEIVERGRAALVGHVQHIDAGNGFEQFGDQMRPGAYAGRAVCQLAGILLRIGDQLLHRIERRPMERDEDIRRLGQQMNRDKAPQRIVRQVFPERDICRHRALRRIDPRVAVRPRARRLLGPDRAARAATVVDQDGLTQRSGKFFRNEARIGVGDAAGRERHDPGDRTTWKFLARGGRHEPERGEDCGHEGITS